MQETAEYCQLKLQISWLERRFCGKYKKDAEIKTLRFILRFLQILSLFKGKIWLKICWIFNFEKELKFDYKYFVFA